MNLISHLRKVTSLLISLTAALLLVLGLSFTSYSAPAIASETPHIGEIEIFPYTFCPEGFLEARGQLVPVMQNQALFSLLGISFGGDGRTTFGLPDLSGRFPIGVGNGAGLPAITLGQKAGAASVTLTPNNLPPHTHPYATTTVAAANVTTEVGGSTNVIQSITSTAGTGNTGATGSGTPVNILPPFVGVKYCIATQGIYPSRP
jgi:microcystin-dependent protein